MVWCNGLVSVTRRLDAYFVCAYKIIQSFLQALIDAHDQIGAIWLERGSGVDDKLLIEEKDKPTEDESEENGDMPVETVKVVGLRKVPGQPLGLTVSKKADRQCTLIALH